MIWKINGVWSLNDNSDAVLKYYKHSDMGYVCEKDVYK